MTSNRILLIFCVFFILFFVSDTFRNHLSTEEILNYYVISYGTFEGTLVVRNMVSKSSLFIPGFEGISTFHISLQAISIFNLFIMLLLIIVTKNCSCNFYVAFHW